MQRFSVNKIELLNFRNYTKFTLENEANSVIITGPNGAGKTSILEAVSLLLQGKGLKNAKLHEIDNVYNDLPWKLNFAVTSLIGEQEISIYRHVENDKSSKAITLNDVVARNTEINKIFSIIWHTPQMDKLFLSSNEEKRKFFDRIVFSFDVNHASHMHKYEHYMRERLQLLKNNIFDDNWLSLLESQMVENAALIISARNKVLSILNETLKDTRDDFIKTSIVLEKQENDNFLDKLRESRMLDSQSGKTNYGPQRAEFNAINLEKEIEAKYSSTGEQKSMLISIILAQVKSAIKERGAIPVILLDEIAAHLDEKKRLALFEELNQTNAQIWITGTSSNTFDYFRESGKFIDLSS